MSKTWFAFAALKSPGPLSGSAETVVPRDGAADGSGGMRLGRGGLPPLEQAGANRFLRGFPRPAKQSVKACVCHVAAGAIRPGLWRWAFRSARIFSVPRRRIPRSRRVTGPFIHCGPKRTKREFFSPALSATALRRPGSSRIKSNFLLREAILPHSTFCSVQFLHLDRFAPYHRQRCVITGRQNSCIARNAPGFSPRSRI